MYRKELFGIMIHFILLIPSIDIHFIQCYYYYLKFFSIDDIVSELNNLATNHQTYFCCNYICHYIFHKIETMLYKVNCLCITSITGSRKGSNSRQQHVLYLMKCINFQSMLKYYITEVILNPLYIVVQIIEYNFLFCDNIKIRQ